MKWLEWMAIGGFIIIGLACLTMSAAWAAPVTTIHTYMHQLFLVCSWTFLPLGTCFLLLYLLMER